MDDEVLLSSLGVTSANPEDIERHVLAEAEVCFQLCIFFLPVCVCLWQKISNPLS